MDMSGTKAESQPKRHHYVPLFLLRRFANPDGQLFQMDKKSGKPGKCNPEDAACVKWYHRYRDDEGNWQNDLEPALAEIESLAANALARLEETDILPGTEDRATVAAFLALQHARTPYGQGISREMYRVAGKALLEVNLTNEPVESLAEILGEEGVPLAHDEAERQREILLAQLADGTIEIEPRREAGLQGMLHSMTGTGPVIEGLAWSLLRSPQGTGFAISDTPLTMWNPEPKFAWSGDGWHSGPMAQTTLPLRPDLCLKVTPSGSDFVAREATRQEVDAINARTFGWADRWIYAPSQQALQDLRQLTKRRGDLVTRPRPGRMVIVEDADPETERPPQRGWPSGLWVHGKEFVRYEIGTNEIPRRRR